MPDSTRQAAPFTLLGRYLFPATGQPIADGAVTIQGERIVAVGRPTPGAVARDLGNVAILPGLVNAHTHLEFSHLTEPLGREEEGEMGRGGEGETAETTSAVESRRLPISPSPYLPLSFVAWLRSVTASRPGQPTEAVRAVEAGLSECLREGTTTLGEIAQPGWSPEPFERAGLDATIFLELIGPTPERAERALQSAERHLAANPMNRVTTSGAPCWRPGLSPHAPYSVRPELLAAAVRLSHQRRVPLAFHLAESREELELLDRGTGPLRELLAEMGAWSPNAFQPGTRPLDYLRTLAGADRALVVHGNYLDDEEIAFLAGHADRMAAVYCPRTHAWFRHDPYPLAKMLRVGVTVALGTDSRASAPDLSLLAEMRFVAQAYPQLPRGAVLRLGTIDAARALGRDRESGSIEPGKAADLAVVPLDDRSSVDPYELLFDSDRPVAATWRLGAEAGRGR